METILYNSDNRDYYASFFDEVLSQEPDFCGSKENYIDDMLVSEWREFLDIIADQYDVVVCGELGLWHGRKKIVPTRMSNLISAVYMCNKDAYETKVSLVDGHIEMAVTHHDGTNNYKIYKLNNRGINTRGCADLSKKCYHCKFKLAL